jgi:diguanylate cyclase (GGDEF)-like protein/PAS domain S-box-containing protein
MQRWFTTLKFKIITMVVLTGVLSAVGTAQLVLITTRDDIQRLLMQGDSDDSERTAALLATKIDMLQGTLISVARQTQPAMWQDPAAMTQFLADKPAIGALFDSVFAAQANGDMLARLVKGAPTANLPNIADRAYFQKALKTDQPVVSEPIVGKVSNSPIVVISIPVLSSEGKVTGIIAGSLTLESTSLFSEVTRQPRQAGSSTLIMNRVGILLAHPDAKRVMGSAGDEPGLMDVFNQWHSSGSPIDTNGKATLSNGYLVSMAGIPVSDWVLVRLTPQAVALQPVAAARITAWKAAAGVGLVAAVLAGISGLYLTRPISALRRRAEKMLAEVGPSSDGWPQERGEVGELARAFQQVVEQRYQKQGETQALLEQLEAVLDHAEVGIALTRNGHFELVSRHFCHIFRCEKQHALGQPSRMIYASDAAYQSLSERARPAFMEHGSFDGEVELMRRSGQLFWAHMRGRAVLAGDRSKGTIWTIEDVTEVRKQRERLTWTSSHDSLTGLFNRAAFETLLEDATQRAGQEPFCALFIDLDRFKQVNDTGGHAAGDALLRDVAHALAAHVRKSDTVARLGGDEFAVLLNQCPLSKAQNIAEKLRGAVISYQLQWEGHVFGVGASIGLVRVDSTFTTAVDVLRAADTACYAAKQQGRNCVTLYGATS